MKCWNIFRDGKQIMTLHGEQSDLDAVMGSTSLPLVAFEADPEPGPLDIPAELDQHAATLNDIHWTPGVGKIADRLGQLADELRRREGA